MLQKYFPHGGYEARRLYEQRRLHLQKLGRRKHGTQISNVGFITYSALGAASFQRSYCKFHKSDDKYLEIY